MNFELRFSEKEITPHGDGLIMKRMLDRLEFEPDLQAVNLHAPNSSRGMLHPS